MSLLRSAKKKYYHEVLKRCFKCGCKYVNGIKRVDCCKLYNKYCMIYYCSSLSPTFDEYVKQHDEFKPVTIIK